MASETSFNLVTVNTGWAIQNNVFRERFSNILFWDFISAWPGPFIGKYGQIHSLRFPLLSLSNIKRASAIKTKNVTPSNTKSSDVLTGTIFPRSILASSECPKIDLGGKRYQEQERSSICQTMAEDHSHAEDGIRPWNRVPKLSKCVFRFT